MSSSGMMGVMGNWICKLKCLAELKLCVSVEANLCLLVVRQAILPSCGI